MTELVDFSNAPVSITEARAARSEDGSLWTARDVLVSLLRDIDGGKISVDALFVAYQTCTEGESKSVGYRQAGMDAMATVGVAHAAMARFHKDTME
jgi:hypothetical protein